VFLAATAVHALRAVAVAAERPCRRGGICAAHGARSGVQAAREEFPERTTLADVGRVACARGSR